MSLDQFRNQQEKEISSFEKLAQEQPLAAKQIAEHRLREAGIIDNNGEFVRR